MYLGLDLGTSELKALLLDREHRIVALARAPLTVSRPAPLWSEQAPAQWWAALEAVMASLRESHAGALAAVRAIGLSGQMHGAVLLGADDRPIRPVILWNDGRSHAEAAELHASHPDLAARVGVLPMPGLTAPKLVWLRRHEPPRQQGHTEPDEGARGDGELEAGWGGHDAPCVTLAPMNRGRGAPVAIRRIHIRVATYSPSRAVRMSCPIGVPKGAT